jgi:hypothetical protein
MDRTELFALTTRIRRATRLPDMEGVSLRRRRSGTGAIRSLFQLMGRSVGSTELTD